MTENARPYQRIEDDVRQFFAELVQRLPEGAAVLSERPGSFPEGLVVTLAPRRPDAAALTMDAHNGSGTVHLHAGLGTLLEVVFPEDRYTGVTSLKAEFGPICEAVLAGRISEVVWHRGKELVRCSTRILLDNGTRWRGYYSNSAASLLRIGESKQLVQYCSYTASP